MAGRPGAINSWLQIETGPAVALTNPAALAGAAGLMAQLAVQHEMAQIKSYLASIDSKVDDVLQAQRDAEVSKVIGAGLDIEDAMAVLERQGQVDDDTWSIVQGRQQVITDTQMWAVLRLEALAKKVEHERKINTVVTALTQAESEVSDLLAVLARCIELQDGLDVLRLSRFRDNSSAGLDEQRRVLQDNRQKRQARVLEAVEDLMVRLDAAAETAKASTLLHGLRSRTAVRSVNGVGETVGAFSKALELDADRLPVEAVRWRDAAREPRQLKSAGAEAARRGAVVVAGVATLGLATVGAAAVKGKSG